MNEFIKLARKETGFKAIKVTKLKDFFYLMIFEKREYASELDHT